MYAMRTCRSLPCDGLITPAGGPNGLHGTASELRQELSPDGFSYPPPVLFDLAFASLDGSEGARRRLRSIHLSDFSTDIQRFAITAVIRSK
jgi:hypothetical protein